MMNRFFAKIAVEKHSAGNYGHVMHCRDRGLAEIEPAAYLRLLEFDRMSQTDRLAVIDAGMQQLHPNTDKEVLEP